MSTFQIYFPSADVYYVEPKRGSHAYRVCDTAACATQFDSLDEATAEIAYMGFHNSTSADDDFAAYVTSVPGLMSRAKNCERCGRPTPYTDWPKCETCLTLDRPQTTSAHWRAHLEATESRQFEARPIKWKGAKPGFYVSAKNDKGDAVLAEGPFPTHMEALVAVWGVSQAWGRVDPRAPWYYWGTARVRA